MAALGVDDEHDSRVADDLCLPDAYGDLRPTHVERIDTHISSVFLLDRDVFKIKRAVDLGFLDFTTLEKRRRACDAEVRLNARLAPGVYHGVVPINRIDGRPPRIGGEGAVVDWAVHMTRLPDSLRADLQLAGGNLPPEAVERIAERIARFHADAECDERTCKLGTPDAIALNVDENFTQTRGLLGAYLQPGEVAELLSWQSRFVRDHRALFERRIAHGRVRDGHGDLRLEHVYVTPDAITVLDCIEFNDRFRFGDVCGDIAFLSMDFAAHGRVDLAERLLARYARAGNDFDLYALVDFYESYRAFVRGKIGAMVAADPRVDDRTRRRASLAARRYFALALSADRRSLLRPSVVAVGGIIASGKSTVALHVGDDMGAPVIEADRTRKSMVGAAATEPIHEAAWHGTYDPAFTDRVYEELWRRAAVVLASGRPVVVDASFRSAAMRRAVRDLAVEYNVPFRFVECRADDDVCRARLRAREHERSVSDGRLAIFNSFRARVEPVTELSGDEHIVVDTTRPIDATMGDVRRRVDVWPAGFVA